jgi:3-hydroxymyristoyl/3-hydroxydecanoyl-(acyl carrier protein) dehydratase
VQAVQDRYELSGCTVYGQPPGLKDAVIGVHDHVGNAAFLLNVNANEWAHLHAFPSVPVFHGILMPDGVARQRPGRAADQCHQVAYPVLGAAACPDS